MGTGRARVQTARKPELTQVKIGHFLPLLEA